MSEDSEKQPSSQNLAELLVGTHEMVDWGGSVKVKGHGDWMASQGTELTTQTRICR